MASITKQEKPEETETALDEANETPELEAKEQAESTEEHSGNPEVPLSEEFQIQAVELLKGATKAELSFIRDLSYQRDEELHKTEDVTMDDFAAVKE